MKTDQDKRKKFTMGSFFAGSGGFELAVAAACNYILRWEGEKYKKLKKKREKWNGKI